MPLRRHVVLGILVVAMSLGCTRAPVKPDAIVGDYIYHSSDKGAQHDPDRLTLRADGKYILVHMPGGHPGSTEEGEWRLVDGRPPNILLDHAGYPIEIKGKDVRLLVDDDLGQWYEKTKS